MSIILNPLNPSYRSMSVSQKYLDKEKEREVFIFSSRDARVLFFSGSSNDQKHSNIENQGQILPWE